MREGEAVLAVGDLQPALQAGLRDSEVSGDLGDRRLALAGHGDDVTTELPGNGLGTMLILPARPQPHRQGVN
jgi:hypothetical protein